MKNNGITHSLRFIKRHILRNAFKSFLTAILAVIFIIGVTAINLAIVINEQNLDELYETVTVDMDIVKMIASGGTDGFIYQSTIDKILETDFVRDYYTEGSAFLPSVMCFYDEKGRNPDKEAGLENCYALTFENADMFMESHDNIVITYFDMYDMSIFSSEWEYAAEPYAPVIIPEELYDMHIATFEDTEANPGYLEITVNSDGYEYRHLFQIAGYYSGEISLYKTCIILPTSALLNWFEHIGDEKLMRYSVAKFSIDPSKNREMQDFRIDIARILNDREAGTESIKAVIWDSELRDVAEPLENTVRLLKILYPAVILISLLIAVGVCTLFTMLSMKDAAIMHVQGTSKARVRVILTLQMVFTCIIGLIIGLVGMYLYMRYTCQPNMNEIFTETLKVAGLYLIASIFGSATTSVFVTRKHPIELLQVKE